MNFKKFGIIALMLFLLSGLFAGYQYISLVAVGEYTPTTRALVLDIDSYEQAYELVKTKQVLSQHTFDIPNNDKKDIIEVEGGGIEQTIDFWNEGDFDTKKFQDFLKEKGNLRIQDIPDIYDSNGNIDPIKFREELNKLSENS